MFIGSSDKEREDAYYSDSLKVGTALYSSEYTASHWGIINVCYNAYELIQK